MTQSEIWGSDLQTIARVDPLAVEEGGNRWPWGQLSLEVLIREEESITVTQKC